MKAMKVLVVVAFGVALLGCTSFNSSQFSGPVNVNVDAPLRADINIGEKITGTATIIKVFGVITTEGSRKYADGVNFGGNSSSPFNDLLSLSNPLTEAKAAAAFDAIEKSGADVIIAPRYMVQVEDYFVAKKIIATVTGYKGTFNGFKAKN